MVTYHDPWQNESEAVTESSSFTSDGAHNWGIERADFRNEIKVMTHCLSPTSNSAAHHYHSSAP